MNAVEIEEAVSELASSPFDPAEFPFAFLTAFGNKATTVNRLRTPSLNKSDVAGGVLQARNIHLAVSAEGRVRETMAALRASTKTAANKVKFLLATDGVTLEAEDLVSDEPPIICNYPDFAEHFGFFLPLAGISTVRAIKNNPIDIKATGRLNKLYVELLKDNPEWATEARRHEMNQFMARLIFCFFAEDTGIFLNHLFTETIEQMSDSQSGNTHEVLQELFRAMATPTQHEGKLDGRYRKAAGIKNWADAFPFVNGGLFPEAGECPRFSRIARSYLLRAAELNWQEINPDIFGSMIQAVADDEERGELGMHYTSVPNILKVLNPLFLDDLREQLEAAGDNLRKLRNLRKRLGAIRVFDPACGSGNFLVIAYREMRQIEHEIVTRTGDKPKSVIPLANFYGIEIKGFAAEIARLALLIAEFQCDVRLISQKEARLNVLPLHKTGQIRTDDALHVNWVELCPSSSAIEKEQDSDQSSHLKDTTSVEERPDVYICGNPPYIWSNDQTVEQKSDLLRLQATHGKNSKILDYVSGWILKFISYGQNVKSAAAFVTTNSITQGSQVDALWSIVLNAGYNISFAHTTFKWANLAKANAGVSCVIVGLQKGSPPSRILFEQDTKRIVGNISPYLLPMDNTWIKKTSDPLNGLMPMLKGNQPTCGGGLLLSKNEKDQLVLRDGRADHFIKRLVGSDEISSGAIRYCIWIEDSDAHTAATIPDINERLAQVCDSRQESTKAATRDFSKYPHRFTEIRRTNANFVAVPCVSSEAREFLTPEIFDQNVIITNRCFGVYGAPVWYLAIIASRLHQQWVEVSSGKLETRLNYSNTLSWNTFPVPSLTDNNKAELTRCAEDILLTREAYFPATIAELYDPENMPDDLRAAHERNDETLERIYIGRRFRNDTERLEKLFDLYTKMTADKVPKKPTKKGAA